MPTECNPATMRFAPVERRQVVADFDGGAMSSDAGALLLSAIDQAIGLVDRFASCFADARAAGLVEHRVAALVGQRVFGIALGYEDVSDHDQLRHDPVMGARREAGGTAFGLRAAGREEHVEPAGIEPGGADPLPQDRP